MDAYEALKRLAEAAGIEARYWDIHGQLHETTPETMQAMLRALGIPADTEADVEAGLASFAEEPWRNALPSVIVARENSEIEVPFRLPADDGAKTIRWTVRLETGGMRTGVCDLSTLPVEGMGRRGTISVALRRLKLAPLPLGYHDLHLAAADEATARLIVAPWRCYLQPKFSSRRCWGLATQLYALKSPDDWGIGDFGQLQALIDRLAAGDADAVGLNPLHALFLDAPENVSPYSPNSRLFRNSLYLDVTAIPDFAESDAARALVEAPDVARVLRRAHDAEFVDYEAVAAVKLAVLDCLYSSFDANHVSRMDESGVAFRAFVERSGRNLDRFATFQMLSEHFGTHDWMRWPAACRDPEAGLVSELRGRHADRVMFFKYLQWQCEEQLFAAAELARQRGMAVGLYNDLAVSVDAASADHWARQDLFIGGARIGAPPDPFNEAGQEWGVVPPNPFRLRAAGYEPFITLLRANMRHTGALRIDHVMGWQRLFLIPNGAKPATGAYVGYPLDDLLAITALESQRHRCAVIGEDLGTVPAGFRERMAAANVLSCRIFAFEREHDRFRRPDEYPRLASVSAATHDLATLRGFWGGGDIAAKANLGLFKSPDEEAQARSGRSADKRMLLQSLADEALLPDGVSPSDADRLDWTPELALAVHAYLARSPSLLFLAQLDDLAGEAHQANLPGSTTQYPNWRRRQARMIDDLFTEPATQKEMTTIAVERAK
ncbi:MAG: 4-alpha-glucanotransferase [Rhizomicrobium sp.]|jgi:4-alpha-glucanotransferase